MEWKADRSTSVPLIRNSRARVGETRFRKRLAVPFRFEATAVLCVQARSRIISSGAEEASALVILLRIEAGR